MRGMRRVTRSLALGLLLAIGCRGSLPAAPTPQQVPPAVAAAAIFLTPNSWDLPAGGGSLELTIVTAGNAGGNVVAPNVDVALSASSGVLSDASPRTDSTGHATVTWTGTSSATVVARAGDIQSAAAIRVPGTPPPPPPSSPHGPPPPPTPPPPPKPPTPENGVSVTIAVTPEYPVVGEPALFTAIVTTQPASPVAAYAWDFDGGAIDDTGASAVWTFRVPNVNLVTLTVTTADGRTTTQVGRIIVLPAPTPTILTTLSATPDTVAPGGSVALTATATPNSSAGSVTSYQWDFDGNGTIDQTTPGASTSTSYATVGTKTVKVTARSATASGTASASVTVTAPPLTVGLTVSGSQTAGSTLTFTARVTTSSGDLPPSMTFGWDYDGNGTVDEVTTGSSPRSVNRVYNVRGTYTPKVTLTAPDGRTATNTITLVIS